MAYSLESTVNELLANDAARAIIDKYLPGASSHPQVGMAGGMTLAAVVQFGGKLFPPQTVEKIEAELRALKD
ncbi:hypothetical protein QTH91_14955 [Variovorax dokdonensis]|uniref:Uncharacterized protein n=1 Tax=Variovorax dokdonensis TaxID=344883 RepID=A0ABT7ND71_9BURK|nr:hypothetical protein [Variovorax dokdonensis]MDM0045785.1 hypothetical protein [Variovorax dokdonensis]